MEDLITVHTGSVDETRALAEALAALAQPGDLLLLAGDLGAGKTAFVQGYGRGLGVEQRITSPTFTLANRYQGRVMLHHLDVYRLDQLEEIKELGLYELLDGTSVTLIEWGDAIAPVVPADYLEVRFRLGEGDDERTIQVRPVGSRWTARRRSLAEAVEPWREAAR